LKAKAPSGRAGTVPAPNQITKIGMIATFGTDEKPISSGYSVS